MNRYIATFHSHFGALLYCKALKKQGIDAILSPVPRKISSSCGTCVCYEHDAAVDRDACELDGVFIENDGALQCVIRK